MVVTSNKQSYMVSIKAVNLAMTIVLYTFLQS